MIEENLENILYIYPRDPPKREQKASRNSINYDSAAKKKPTLLPTQTPQMDKLPLSIVVTKYF